MRKHPEVVATQTDRLIDYMRQGASVTSLEAWSMLGISRLSEIVRRVEKRGYTVAHCRTRVPTRYGESNVTRYSLIREPQ